MKEKKIKHNSIVDLNSTFATLGPCDPAHFRAEPIIISGTVVPIFFTLLSYFPILSCMLH